MTMKKILAHVEDQPGLDSVLTASLLVARRFDAHVQGLCLRPVVPRIMPVAPEGAFIPTSEVLDDLERADRERGERLRRQFEDFMRAKDVALTAEPAADTHLSASWREKSSAGDEELGSLGRVFDLIVVGRPVTGASAPSMSALESALFESGRPILIAPPETPAKLGDRVTVAWNGSTETARSIALTLPFLAQAEEVMVLSVEEGMVAGPSAADVADYLLCNGVTARPKYVRAGERSVGAAILEEAAAAGTDLLLKGAYTHSRLRQMIFGGATSHILNNAELPVLMAH